MGRICFINQRSNTYIWSIHFELADSHTDVSGCKNYTKILCIIPSSFSFGLFPMITFSPLSIQLGFFLLACMLAYFSLAFCRLTSLCSAQSTGIPNVMVYELCAKLKWNSCNKIIRTYHFAQLGYHVDHVNVAYDDSRYLWYLQMVDGHPFASTYQNMSQQKNK